MLRNFLAIAYDALYVLIKELAKNFLCVVYVYSLYSTTFITSQNTFYTLHIKIQIFKEF